MRRPIMLFLVVCTLLARPVRASDEAILLSADEVASAADIESAISAATAGGTRPGTVLLDASAGAFTYSALDRTINIAYPNVTLRSSNGAVIENCDDGVLLEPGKSDNATIEGIGFSCLNSGILAPSNEQAQVTSFGTLRQNVIDAHGFGIQVVGGYRWTITSNRINAGTDALNLSRASGSLVTNNWLVGNELAVQLHFASGNKIINNALEASYQGILLTTGSNGNRISHNRVAGPSHSGISLEDGCQGNRVHGNIITCAADSTCVAVSGSSHAFALNRISGNKLR